MISFNLQLNGLNEALASINEEARRLSDEELPRRLMKCAMLIKRKSQLIVPVDTSNLKNSADVQKFGEGRNMAVVVGYYAYYALYVHEDATAKHKPGKTFKFLERAINESQAELINIIRNG